MNIAAIGIDVGGTHIRVGLLQRSSGDTFSPGERRRVRWRDDVGRTTPERLADVIERELDGLGVPRIGLPIGVAIAGQLDRRGLIVRNAPNLGWRDVPLAQLLVDRLGAPYGVSATTLGLANDLKAILVGELAAGAARGHDPVLAVYVGTGVGGAIAIGGRVITGAGGNAGEIGHSKVAGWTAACGCGQRGCIESLVGGANLLRDLEAAIALGEAGRVPVADLAAVDRAANDGCAWSQSFITERAVALGDTIANACTLINPALVLLGGGTLDRSPRLRAEVESRIQARTVGVSAPELSFASGELGDDAGWIGAASMVSSRRIRS